jgi:hypothetical protein
MTERGDTTRAEVRNARLIQAGAAENKH